VVIPTELVLSPKGGLLAPGETFSFSGTPGVLPLETRLFSVSSNLAQIDSQSGLFVAPVSDGSVTVRLSSVTGLEAVANFQVRTPVTGLMYRYQTSTWNYPHSITSDSQGNVYFAAESNATAGGRTWAVAKYTASTESYSTVLAYQYQAGKGAIPYTVAVDSQDRVYAMGYGLDSQDIRRGVLQRSSDGGQTWNVLIDDWVNGTVYGVAFDASGAIYVVGTTLDATGDHWVVRRSVDGVTWTTIDDHRPAVGLGATAKQVMFDPSGRLYVVGLSGGYITLRSTVNDGATWQVHDQYKLNPSVSNSCSFHASNSTNLGIDSAGTVYYGGNCPAAVGGTWDGVVRKFDPKTGQATLFHHFPTWPHMTTVFVDRDDNVLIGGRAYIQGTQAGLWVLRDEGALRNLIDAHPATASQGCELDSLTQTPDGRYHSISFCWWSGVLHATHKIY
jgi:hypothetical protein